MAAASDDFVSRISPLERLARPAVLSKSPFFPLRLAPREPLAGDERWGHWVAAACEGDVRAQRHLYEQTVDAVFRCCVRLLRNRENAKDIVQESYIVAFEKLGTLAEPSSFPAWICRIAVRRVHDRLRKERFLRFFRFDGDEPPLPWTDLDGESPALARLDLERVDALLRAFPTRHRTAWILRNVEMLTLPEVADACECSLASTKRWIADVDARIEEVFR